MRKWVTVLVAGWLCLCAAGCKKQVAAPAATTDFSCNIQAVYDQLAVTGTLVRRSAGTLELAFTSPETLNGLTAVWDGEDVTLQMHGLSFSVNADALPEQALGDGVLAALDSVLDGAMTPTLEGDTAVYEGTVEQGAYTLVCDKQSGKPLSLTMPSLKLQVTFDYP